MNRRQKGSICLLGMIMMLVLGMCFERIGADSLLAYDVSRFTQEDAAPGAVLGNVESIPLCGQTYLKNAFGTQEVAAMIRHAARKWIDYSHRMGDSCLWQPGWILSGLSDGGCRVLCGDGSDPVVYRHIMIISYIHKKDGKKA